MEELVSIVVPVYNVEAYLDECVQSLVDQTYCNLEIILVDDGSTDRSGSICDLWTQKDERIRVIHKENAGAGMARNTGMDMAGGKYLFFVDSDDYFDLTTVEKCICSAQQNGAEVVLFGRNNIHADGHITQEKISPPRLVFHGEELRTELLPGMFTYRYGYGITVAGRMHDLDILRRHGISFESERKVGSEDSVITLEEFSKVETVSIVPECLYYYRKRSDSFSRRYQENRQLINNQFLQYSRGICEKLAYSQAVVNHIRARYHMYSLAHMKQIVAAGVSVKEKYTALRKVFEDPFLLQSVTDEALLLCNRPSRLFWQLFRRRCFWSCWLLLWYKSHR